MVKLNLGELPIKTKINSTKPKKPCWYKATEDHINQFKLTLEEKVGKLSTPTSLYCQNVHCTDTKHSVERDAFVLDLLGAMIESTHAHIPMSGGGLNRKKPDSGRIPGWKENVEPLRQDSLFWHQVWLSAGRPNKGELFNIMKRTRNKYHHALRKIRKAAEAIKGQKLFEASMWGGGDLLKELKKTRGGKYSPDLPETVAGANGEHEICDKF